MLPVFTKPLEVVTPEDVEQLIVEQYPEGFTTEFKGQLSHKKGGTDPWYTGGDVGAYARDKLLEEVIAFANADGGNLILGIAETKQRPSRARAITPVPRCGELAERLRLQIRDCIEPQIPLVHTWGVPTDNQGQGVVLLRVPPSPFAPHRNIGTLQSYIRRADRSERMTMREIQDLTRQRDLGAQAIEKHFLKRSRDFRQWVRHTQTPSALGLRVTLIPSYTPILAEKVYNNLTVFPLMRPNLELLIQWPNNSIRFDLKIQSPTGTHERPILRGACRRADTSFRDTIQELYCDGLCEIRSLVLRDSDSVRSSEILGYVANGLFMADAFRQHVIGSVDMPYFFEMELVRFNADIRLSEIPLWHGLMPTTITPNPCLFPRLTIGNKETFNAVMLLIMNDLYNAAGVEAFEGDVTLIQPSP